MLVYIYKKFRAEVRHLRHHPLYPAYLLGFRGVGGPREAKKVRHRVRHRCPEISTKKKKKAKPPWSARNRNDGGQREKGRRATAPALVSYRQLRHRVDGV